VVEKLNIFLCSGVDHSWIWTRSLVGLRHAAFTTAYRPMVFVSTTVETVI